MSPIFTRPYREQHEHDRIIRQLQARYRRKHEVVINPGPEQHGSVTVGELPVYPDLLLYSQEPTRHLEAIVEVETGESVHLLEARAEWGVFSQVPVPFILYVPTPMLETARRIIDEQQWRVSEIWTYLPGMDHLRFVQVFKHPTPPVVVAPKMPARAKARAATTTQTATSRKAPAPTAEQGRGASPRRAAQAVTASSAPSGKASGKTAAKAMPTPVARGTAKAAGKTAASAKPVPKAAARAAASKAAAKAAPKPAPKAASVGKKAVASTKPTPAGGRKSAGARKASPPAKNAAASAKKPAASARSASAKSASGRGATSTKTASSGKAARRR